MALTREAYRALEDIVGLENISEEPAILDGYAFMTFVEITIGTKFMPRPGAVLLPGSTEEVQAVVKACNKYGIKFHAHSTGFGPWSAAGIEDTVMMDMRRMNRILEIDDKNMYAVVEPYVTFSELHVEAIKKGLRPNVIGAGPSCSVLANHSCGAQGMGPTSISCGVSRRNVLGIEWVTPTGEVVRMGAAGVGAGWFCSDGPGPSLRGITGGYNGSMGGLGVFTKCSVKLHPWPGPPEHRSKGRAPMYEPEIPETFRVYLVSFPSYEKMDEAKYLITEEGIAYGYHRMYPFWLAGAMTGSNQELWELWQKGVLQEK